ncbi:hypothetical protein OF83DRAFT_1295100 [Amylostereum chailletii]|nr:hypothetical protein OF83DRAFT_1295100 [Amylostereum chailletii]
MRTPTPPNWPSSLPPTMDRPPPNFPQPPTWRSAPTHSTSIPPPLPPRGPPPPIPPRPPQYPSAQQAHPPPPLPPRRTPVPTPPSSPPYNAQSYGIQIHPGRSENWQPVSPSIIPQVRRVPPPPSRDQAPPNPYAEITTPPPPYQSSEQHTSSYSHPPPASVEAASPPIRALENMSISSPPPSPAPVVASAGQTPTETPAELSSSSLTPSSTPTSPPPRSRPQSQSQRTSPMHSTPMTSTPAQPSSPTPTASSPYTTIPNASSFVAPWSGVPAACPTSNGQLHLPGAQWHGIPSLGPTFHICNRCFQTQIAPSRFASQFSPMPTKDEDVDPAHPPTCQFFARRSRKLWMEALKTGNLGPFEAYVRTRGTLPVCAGHTGVKGGDACAPPRWYGPAPAYLRALPELRICAACYEDEMVGTQAEPCLSEVRTIVGHAPDVVWTCAFAQQFLRGCLLELAQGLATWDVLVGAMNTFGTIPKCPGPGQGVSPASRAWFRPKPTTRSGESVPVPGMVVCAGCYMDYVLVAVADEVPGLHQDMFERVPDEETVAAAKDDLQWSCDLCHPAVLVPCVQMSHRPVGQDAKRRGWDDERVWRTAAQTFLSEASCFAQEGSAIAQGANVYKLRTSAPLDFDVCESCYTSYAVALGAERFLVRAPAPSNGSVRCDFGLKGNPRFGVLFFRWMASAAMDDLGRFETYVRERWQLPGCPRDNRGQEGGKMWYGTGTEFVCCPECYLDVVKSSALDGAMTMHNVYEPSPLSCMLYSPRARAQWSEACAANSLAHFIALQQSRRTTYAEIIPRLAALNATWNRRLKEQAQLLDQSTRYMTMAANSSAASMRTHSTNMFLFGGYGGAYTGNDGLGQMAGSFTRQADDARRRANAIVVVTEEERAEEAELLGRWKAVE